MASRMLTVPTGDGREHVSTETKLKGGGGVERGSSTIMHAAQKASKRRHDTAERRRAELRQPRRSAHTAQASPQIDS